MEFHFQKFSGSVINKKNRYVCDPMKSMNATDC